MVSAASPDCWRCRHHQITHDASFPYGCLAMGFRSRRLPMIEVAAASGAQCLAYQEKATLPLSKRRDAGTP